MRKAVAVVILLLFAGLQTYQLCDASQDLIEDLPSNSQVASRHETFLSRPVAPDDDADDQIPQVFDQTLMPSAFSLIGSLALSQTLFVEQDVVLASAAVAPVPKDLSPPVVRDANSNCLGYSNQTFVATLRSLAPPVA